MTCEHGSFRTTIACLKADKRRLVSLHGGTGISFHPSFICVTLHRVSHHFFQSGHTLLARLVGQLNEMLTGADVSPAAEFGEGLVILTPPGIALSGKAGRNLTVMPCAGLGGELGRTEDVGGGPGLPVLGDDVVLEPHGGALGPVRIGSRVRVGAGVLVTTDVPDDSIVEGPRPRVMAQKQL
jgi:serine O-acetyltransferase